MGELQKRGNSQGVRLTKSVLEEAGVGDKARVSVRKGIIVFAPDARVRGKYDLKTLLFGIEGEHRLEELDWGSRAGKEAW